VLRVEPEILRDYVAAGAVQLAFHHVLDHGAASQTAHLAAECAGSQAPLAFWRMHDLLFERQDQLWQANVDAVAPMADELGLDAAAFRTCMADPATEAKVTRMDQERRDRGVRLRPTFDIGGRLVEGAIPYETFRTVLAEAQQ
jgi:protein-disulfide isomerase